MSAKITTDLWGPIDRRKWQSTPCISGRSATESDVKEGRAVFFINGPSEFVALQLPCRAIQHMEDGTDLHVIVIQAELAPQGPIVGVRYFTGGNGVCGLAEIQVVGAQNDA